MRVVGLLLLFLGATGASWIDPHATARQASHLYADGKFGDAAAKYREALIDDPDSPLLHYNAGLASYRDGKYDDAVAALGAVPSSDTEPQRTARAAYAAGNAKYRLGAAVEAEKPQQALTSYAEALAAYRRAMGADPADEDAKFNHELVEKKIADLKKKLEEQRKEQEQKQQDQQQQQDKKDQQPQDQQQKDQQQAQDQQQQQQQKEQEQQPQDQQQQQAEEKQPGEDEQQKQEQAGQQQQPDTPPDAKDRADAQPEGGEGEQPHDQQQQPQPGDGDAVAGDESDGEEMSPREAQAILDGQRDQEVRPDEIIRRLDHARVAEPREDW